MMLTFVRTSEMIKAYDRAKFLDERKVMMQGWAGYLSDVKQ